jgi:hypothetical protein
MRMISRHTAFYDLLEAMEKPGCAICTLVARTRWRYLDSLAYENVNDPGVRAKLRDAHGFCNRHAWYFVETVREVLGAAIIYRDVLHTLQGLSVNPHGRVALEPPGRCPACLAEDESAAYALQTLGDAFEDRDLRYTLDRSDGPCGPHLLQAMSLLRPGLRAKVLEALLDVSSRRHADRDLRWRATGAIGLFGTDDLALASSSSTDVNANLDRTGDSFTCSVCSGTRAELTRHQSWMRLDDGTGGLCNVHAWMSPGTDCPRVYERQIAAVNARAKELAAAPEDPWLHQALRGLRFGHPERDVVPPPRCFVCAHQAAIETTLCTRALPTLCVPHLQRSQGQRGLEPIRMIQPIWRELDALLGEFLRKEDYRFRSEPRGLEQKSPRWAVALISGVPGIR